jgi:hypothetical protein
MTRILVCSLLLILLSLTVAGQGNTGSILGTVADPSGAVVVGAKVSIVNIRTGVRTETVADTVGNYLFNSSARQLQGGGRGSGIQKVPSR